MVESSSNPSGEKKAAEGSEQEKYQAVEDKISELAKGKWSEAYEGLDGDSAEKIASIVQAGIISDERTRKNEKRHDERHKSNQNLRKQILSSRKCLLIFLVSLMAIESIVLFLIVIFSSLPAGSSVPDSNTLPSEILKKLSIDPRTLQILVGATLAQISVMVIVVIRSVYSDTLNKDLMSDRHGT